MTGQTKVNPEAILSEACQAILKYSEDLHDWKNHQSDAEARPYIPAEGQDAALACSQSQQSSEHRCESASSAIRVTE